MINILLFISGVAITVFLILLLIRLRYDRLIKQRWRSLKIKSTGNIFNSDMIAELDEPIQRYFLHAIEPETPLFANVELKMRGSFRLRSSADWLKMHASQIISTAPGFIWRANIGKGVIHFSGVDYSNKGKGRTRFSLWSLIPLVDAQSKNVDRSANGRLGSEYIWLPSALLPHNGVNWKAIDNNTIQANFKINNEPICLTISIDGEGKPLRISLPRWGNVNADKHWKYSTFIGDILEEQTTEGYTIPAKISAAWLDRNQYWTFFQCKLERSKFF